jgi:tRNA (guanine37-N1)-methyltransferase
MKIDVITLFPNMVDAALKESIIGRARSQGLLDIGFTNPRDFAKDKHKTVDDRPYGGGPGMIMMAEPLYCAIKKVCKKNSFIVLLTPKGKRFEQETARFLSRKKHIVLVCGHYEGIDERLSSLVDFKLSIGDYILTGGEPAASVVIDAVSRLIPGVLKKEDAVIKESFTSRLLEFPQWTRPRVWKNMKVPKVLLSGNHGEISKWRDKISLMVTKKTRPDLIKKRM